MRPSACDMGAPRVRTCTVRTFSHQVQRSRKTEKQAAAVRLIVANEKTHRHDNP